jgi:branched-chain amino acid transport system substrate-binding protein
MLELGMAESKGEPGVMIQRFPGTYRKLTCVLAVASASLLLTMATAAPATAAPAKGAPIYVGAECGATPPNDGSECTTVPTAYFDQINAQGGINGRPIKVVTCQNPPADTTVCLKSLLANQTVTAIIGAQTDIGFTRLTQGDPIASIAPDPNSVDDLLSPYAFPISAFPEAGGALGSMEALTYNKGLHKPVYLECEYQACLDLQTSLQEQYASKHIKLTSIVAPIFAPNYTTYVAAAQHAGADVVFIAETATDQVAMIKAGDALNFHPVYALTYSCWDQPELVPFKSLSDTIYCPAPFKLWTQVGGQMAATMKKYGPKTWSWNFTGVLSWIQAHIFVDDLRGIHGSITRMSVIHGMSKLTHFTNEFLPEPINFSKAGPYKIAPRIPNFLWYVYKVVHGKLVSVTPKPINIPPVKIAGLK